MRESQGVGGLAHQIKPEAERPSLRIFTSWLKQRAQRAIREQLHSQVKAARLLAEIVDLNDMLVLEARNRAGLLAETYLERRVECQSWVHQLEGGKAVEVDVAWAVDLAHAAASEQGLDPVVTDLLADQITHGNLSS